MPGGNCFQSILLYLSLVLTISIIFSNHQEPNNPNVKQIVQLKYDTDDLDILLPTTPQAVVSKGYIDDLLRSQAFDKTVVVSFCNSGELVFLDNLVDSLVRVGVKHFVIFAADRKALDIMRGKNYPSIYAPEIVGDLSESYQHQYSRFRRKTVPKKVLLMLQKEFRALCIAKLKVAQEVSRLGYDFLFTDVDVVFLKNPLDELKLLNTSAFSSEMKLSDNYPMGINSGFYFLKGSHDAAYGMLTHAISLQVAHPKLPDQFLLNFALEKYKDMLLPVRLQLKNYPNSAYITSQAGVRDILVACAPAFAIQDEGPVQIECKNRIKRLDIALDDEARVFHINGMVAPLKKLFLHKLGLWNIV